MELLLILGFEGPNKVFIFHFIELAYTLNYLYMHALIFQYDYLLPNTLLCDSHIGDNNITVLL